MDVVEINGYTIEPGADLARADLRGAKLAGTDLRQANLRLADLEGAKADENTFWPEGFDPVAAGVIFED